MTLAWLGKLNWILVILFQREEEREIWINSQCIHMELYGAHFNPGCLSGTDLLFVHAGMPEKISLLFLDISCVKKQCGLLIICHPHCF